MKEQPVIYSGRLEPRNTGRRIEELKAPSGKTYAQKRRIHMANISRPLSGKLFDHPSQWRIQDSGLEEAEVIKILYHSDECQTSWLM
ncbi:hypothetical protein AVEN_149326-1 [Araneus ventricosus]|uniref:Uncharacterized protein n=1 Tax=Araneus ventricosus TaxID=182803 RepID=A0A4Y2UDV7_ARAVE|nr:hypothetical protein AVEN_149326-1 [Araneus ventricosus]